MPRKKKTEEVITEAANAVDVKDAAINEAPAEKPKRGRRKKAAAAVEDAAPAKKTTRTPRKKAVVPNFVIQNSAGLETTYKSVVEKIQASIQATDVTSLDIYVKAEEGKAYYVVNGDAAGFVELF